MIFEHSAGIQNLIIVWIAVMAGVAMLCFIVSEITLNYSQVDKLWSLMPIAYSWITVASSPSPRLYIMAILVTLWGLRLSYNFARKGGYNIIPWKGEEDYRWKVMRENPALKGRLRFGLFNFFFISLYQNILIFLFSSPLLLASLYPDKSMNVIDLAATFLMIAFLIMESIADDQLFKFHQIKKYGQKTGELYQGIPEKRLHDRRIMEICEASEFCIRTGNLDMLLFFWCCCIRAVDQYYSSRTSIAGSVIYRKLSAYGKHKQQKVS